MSRREFLAVRRTSERAVRRSRHPISRWYLLPLVEGLAIVLARTSIKPTYVTLVNLALSLGAAALLVFVPYTSWIVALLVWLAWAADRLDGELARRQGTESDRGAWLDANVDELGDIVMHLAAGAALTASYGANWPLWLAAAFVAGKYLWNFGRIEVHAAARDQRSSDHRSDHLSAVHLSPTRAENTELSISADPSPPSKLRRLFNLPGNADIRVHLLIAALLTGTLAIELAWVAAYFNVRWMARYIRQAGLLGKRSEP